MAEGLGGKPPGAPPQSTRLEELYKTSDPRPHLVELDALRGIAILTVVTIHLSSYWLLTTGRVVEIPLLGIDLAEAILFTYLVIAVFFLLSGYLLTWTEGGRERRRGNYSVLNYAKRRVLRLVPAYYVAIAIVVLLWSSTPWFDRPSFEVVAVHLAFLQGLVPPYSSYMDPAFWSLTPEIIFYAALPLLVLKLRKLWQRLIILGVLATISLATRLYMVGYINSSVLDKIIDERFGGEAFRLHFYPTTLLYLFIVGMLLKMLIERVNASRRFDNWRRPASLVLSMVPLALLAALPFVFEQHGQLMGSPLAMVAEALVVLLFTSILLGSPLLKPLLSWKPFLFFGEISYSLFLLHDTVILLTGAHVMVRLRPWLAEQSELVIWLTFGIYAAFIFIVATVMAYLSYRYIESPFLSRKPPK